jgi:hypothetical protein
MFGGLRGQQREISGAGGTQKRAMEGKKGEKKGVFFWKKSTSQ